jgi:hypothetical protein
MRPFALYQFAAFVLLVASTVAGGQTADSSGPEGVGVEPSAKQISITAPQAALIAGQADAFLLEALAACHDLASHKFVLEYYRDETGSPPPHRVLTTLRRTASRLDAAAVHLLEEDGIVVASTNPVAVNQQFGDWFSFSSAMKSGARVLPTISVAKRWREFLISVPVRDRNGSVTGAVVIQHAGSLMDRTLDWDRYSSPIAFVFRDRYAIATNGLWRSVEAVAAVPPSPGTTAFTGNLLELLDDLVPVGNDVTVNGQNYTLHRIPSRLPDWTLIYGTPSG